MKQVLAVFISLSTFLCFAQPTQTIRGKVYDAETNYPLTGVRVQVLTSDTNARYLGGTDALGEFTLKQIPIGKHKLVAKLNSYEAKTITIEVNSGKELILNIPLMEAIITKEEIVVTARRKGEVLNEMAVMSAQQFSVEETNRYPGSRMDPARMASNFAGVQGADDSRNDIVVRGNSPLGIVYRVEGIDIPNPSHFSISGSSGGPVSILNNKILGNSDFFMSAFPAEYGNSTSGIFDLKLRNGNKNQLEFTGQFGFLGTEFLAEGPMSKNKKSSFLVMGRYSTLSLFEKLRIPIGTDAIPVYGDGAFKFNWQLKKGGNLSLFGMGGKSNISILISEKKEYSTDLYGEGDRDQLFGTGMYVSGFNYKKSINEKTFVSATLAASLEQQNANHEYLSNRRFEVNGTDTTITFDSVYPMMAYQFRNIKISGYTAVNHKFNKRLLMKAGVNFDLMSMNQIDSVLVDLNTPDNFVVRWDYQGKALLVQPFAQWKWRANDNFDLTAGVHAQYYSLSNSISPIEPRVGFKYKLGGGQAIFGGGGMHSQIQPYYTYTYHKFDAAGNKIFNNKNMDFSRSLHTGLGYEKYFNKGFSIKTEAYYQSLYNIPVTVAPSSFSMINVGSGFSRVFPDSLKNTGTGYNYGLELTVQKYFDKSFFFLFSGTLYDSKYKGSDGKLRNTSYNGNYVVNLLVGKEFKLGAKHVLGFGTKITRAGGKRYGLVDVATSDAQKEIIFKDSAFNDQKFKDYFRIDFKISWRMNTNKVTHEIGLDLVNILSTKNLLNLAYSPSLDPNVDVTSPGYKPYVQTNQLGFLPLFYYKIDFKLKSKE